VTKQARTIVASLIVTATLIMSTAVQAQMPAVHSLGQLEDQGFMVFDALSGPFIYEARTRNKLQLETVMSSNFDRILPPEMLPIVRNFNNKDEFGRRETLEQMASYFQHLRRRAASSRGIVVKLVGEARIHLHEYNFDTHEMPFDVATTFGANKNYPGGAICEGRVDSGKTRVLRTFCAYPTNWTTKGALNLPVVNVAQQLKGDFRKGKAHLYLLAEYDGAARPSDFEDRVASLQPIRVLGYYLVDAGPAKSVLLSIPFKDNGPLIKHPVKSASAPNKPSSGVAANPPPPQAVRVTKPAILKEIPMQSPTKALTKDPQPILIDLK
jgi:hypothetical protein